ncbi:MAG: hypothetical protein JNL62_09065 [Bryobacterales bacterium]|nr:hypothetical protein [Bryobacterales bacterium]
MSEANENRAKLFGDVLMPRVEYVAMQRILYAMRVMRLDVVQRHRDVSRHAASVPGRMGASTVWWRVKHPDGPDSFINVDPGEYREEPPTGDVMILDMPEMPPEDDCKQWIQACIDRGRMFFLSTEHGRDLLHMASLFLEAPEKVEAEAYALIQECIPFAREAEGDAAGRAFGRLHEQCLITPRMDAVGFSASMLLLQLQRMTNLWIEQDWWAAPMDYLRGFVRHVAGDRQHVPRLAAVIGEVVEINYLDGREMLNRCLNAGSMEESNVHLLNAHHSFGMAFFLSKIAGDVGLNVALPTSATVLEESWVCTMTGLAEGAHLMGCHPNEIPGELLLRRAATGKTMEECARAWGSNHVVPAVNRRFASILAAHAMTLSMQESEVEQGLELLSEHRGSLSEQPLFTGFETGWIDQAMLGAYRKLGREEDVRRLAVRIAGQLTVSRAIAGM